MTTKNQIALDILAGFAKRKATITAMTPCVDNYVLAFEDGIRFVGGTTYKPCIRGFESALMFSNRIAALAFLRRTRIMDGTGTAPEAKLACNAQQHALTTLDGVIATVEAI